MDVTVCWPYNSHGETRNSYRILGGEIFWNEPLKRLWKKIRGEMNKFKKRFNVCFCEHGDEHSVLSEHLPEGNQEHMKNLCQDS
jgi:hypothetical protein